ncbi:putative ABC transporter ATP-binding protein YjkB [Kurthia zopfii]|uniref:Phosphate ABC transporter ATP-binding protein (PhoT family) n=1 Tax=Kurthia zopfii TaxID=1650 RepID=A0A2U3AE25_9BACL|nr:phosphate ABC transporter ATP-binding protein [Kurthia zopfii]PWI22701.1 phosphate ABC transporter ATP-binding protein [Kurthia zopfii]TDR39502.1 phosphate ABC transporter ATP-binding protein (PhoT family) [Kurthia zopfii]STX10811.1 Phosphate import ATP-binding protein PstB 3 [Kurthia zopfii]VEI05802.1 Phosphate import ATP-binding protein PstB 3 [Kurthia zopfii]GEK30571.1 putative ABC transporter ATP-binding protein YjkB [Kurthia zopfii]
MNPINQPAICFENVYFTSNKQQILENISGKIAEAKITAFVGPSGAGKSTLLKMCNRLISQTSGKIEVFNQPIEQFNPIELRREVGISLQSAPMINGTVFDNLNLPKKLQQATLSTRDAITILKDVGLDETFLKKDAKNLSGGQKQRVSIARTLINKSKILLLDEITSALDPTATKEIEQLILSLNKKYNVTIILVTHNIEQAIAISDEIWVLMNGSLIEICASNQLKNSSNPQIQQFLSGVLK